MSNLIRRTVGPAAVLGIAALLLSACASSPSPTSALPAGSTKNAPVSGGNLTFAIASDIACIDPQQIGNNDDIAIARQTVDSLTVQDPKTGAIKPWLASKYSVNSDATSFTFTLRTGATYSDGEAIDAASVKTNFEAIQALGAKAVLGSTYLAGVTAIDVVSSNVVRIDFSAPSAQFLQATSTFSLGLLSPASAKLTQADRCAGKFSGSGPFVVNSYLPNAQAVLARRTGYNWGPSVNRHTGPAYLNTVTYKVVPESSTLTGSLQSGQIDASADIAITDLPSFDGNGFWEVNRTNPGVAYNLYPNESTPKLADKRVRLAIQDAIDRAQVAKLLTKYDKPATSVLSSSTPYFTKLSSVLKYDPTESKKLLDAAGWKGGADGIRVRGGQRLSFLVTYWQPSNDQLQLVQQELRAVGIDLQLKFTTIAQATVANNGTQDFTWGNLTRADPDVARTVFAVQAPSQNVNHRTASAVDPLLAQQAATAAPAARQKLVTQALTLLLKSGDSIPVYQLSTTIAASNKVHDLGFEASSRLDFYDAWISK
jgi:peptide/nickel transport system substrate-binding protein